MSNEKDNDNKKDANKDNQGKHNQNNKGSQNGKPSDKSDKKQASPMSAPVLLEAGGGKDRPQGDKENESGVRKNERQDDDDTQKQEFPSKEKEFNVPDVDPAKYEQKYRDQNVTI